MGNDVDELVASPRARAFRVFWHDVGHCAFDDGSRLTDHAERVGYRCCLRSVGGRGRTPSDGLGFSKVSQRRQSRQYAPHDNRTPELRRLPHGWKYEWASMRRSMAVAWTTWRPWVPPPLRVTRSVQRLRRCLRRLARPHRPSPTHRLALRPCRPCRWRGCPCRYARAPDPRACRGGRAGGVRSAGRAERRWDGRDAPRRSRGRAWRNFTASAHGWRVPGPIATPAAAPRRATPSAASRALRPSARAARAPRPC